MFEEEVLAGITFAPPDRDGTTRLRIHLRLPWYRSLQLSCIERLDVTIDSDEQPQEEVRVVVGGMPHSLAEVALMHDAWWFLLDTIEVEVNPMRPVNAGAHEVSVGLRVRMPYGDPDFRPEMHFTQTVETSKRLTLLGKDD